MQNSIVWHPEVLSPDARETFAALETHPAIKPFYLAGGTALALRWGYRKSADLDFFTEDEVNEDRLLQSLENLSGIKVVAKAPETLHLHMGKTKVSFIGYHYPMLFPVLSFDGISVADPRDISAMKLAALASRGAKRDFVDLYVLSQNYGLKELVGFFRRKFAKTTFSHIHLLKSLTYFADAETEPMPDMLQAITWKEVKEFFIREAPRLRS
jgi:predicted nucleotidyltransferase component of viral defense system